LTKLLIINFTQDDTRRLATTNRSRVSIRVTKMFGQGRWRCRPAKFPP